MQKTLIVTMVVVFLCASVAAFAGMVVTQVGQYGGICNATVVSGNYACPGAWTQDPVQVSPVGQWGGVCNAVAVSGDYAYIGGRQLLSVLDISDPSDPIEVGKIILSPYVWISDIEVSGNYAYLACIDIGLQVIDISDPANPKRIGGYDTGGQSRAVAVSGNYAYVACWNTGLQVVDISNPANPTIVGVCDTGDRSRSVAVFGTHAYVADYFTGLHVIDISDPTNPTRVGECNTGDYAQAVAVSGNYAYVACWNTGLQVISISDPENPTIVGQCDTDGYPRAVAVVGNYAYVANYNEGLQAIDISDPENPTRVGGCDTGGSAQDVAVSGNYIYVATMYTGLVVCRVDTTSPVDTTINDAKKQVDNTHVILSEAVVTAVGDGYFYVERENRTAGIRVELEQHNRDVGDMVEIHGMVKTDENGERYISAQHVETTGSGSIAPLGMTNKSLGGGDFGLQMAGEGQQGVTGGVGLNNIGLLVRTTGACTYIDDHTFIIDDGSDVNVRCVTPPSIVANASWQQVAVTGVSSIRKNGSDYERLLRVVKVNPIVLSGP